MALSLSAVLVGDKLLEFGRVVGSGVVSELGTLFSIPFED